MYYLYVLQSKINKDLYLGYTNDLKKRYEKHIKGQVKTTKGNKPWLLIYYEAYRSKKDATYRERQLKNHKPKSDLKIQIENSLI